jgi:hypothetical protein
LLNKIIKNTSPLTTLTEDTNKLTLLAFKIITVLHNTLLATSIKFWKLSAKASSGIDHRPAVTRSWIAATSAKRAPFVMLIRRGNRKKSTHHTPLIWRPRVPDQGRMAIILTANNVNCFVSSISFVFWYHSPYCLDTPRILIEYKLATTYLETQMDMAE